MALFRLLSSALVGLDHAVNSMRAVVRGKGSRARTQIVFKFDRSLDDPARCFLAWQEGRLRHVRPPLVGHGITL